MNISQSGKAGPAAIKAWPAKTPTTTSGSHAKHFSAGVSKPIEGGKMLIANGVYTGLKPQDRHYG